MADQSKLSYEVELDASGFIQGSSKIQSSAAQAVNAVGAMGAAMKSLTQASRGGSWMDKNIMSSSDAKAMSTNIQVYQQAAKLTKDLTAASQALGRTDVSSTIKATTSAIEGMSQALNNATIADSKQVSALKEQVALYERMARVAKQLGTDMSGMSRSSGIDSNLGGRSKTEIEAQRQLNEVRKQAREAALEQAVTEQKATAATTAGASERVAALQRVIDAEQKLADVTDKAYAAQYRKAANQSAIQTNQAAVDTGRAAAKLEAAAEQDRAAALRASVAAAHEAVQANTAHIHSLENMRFASQEVRNNLTVLAAGVTALATSVVKAAADQDRAFADIARTTQLDQTSGALQALRDQYRQMSTDISKSFSELSQIGTLGAQMNIPAEKLGDFTRAVAEFSMVTGTTTEKASEDFGRLINTFSQAGMALNGGDKAYEQMASQVAELGAKAVATEDEILTMANSISTTTVSAGIGQDATLAYATALTSVGVKAEWARGSLQRIFGNFNKAAAQGAEGMADFAQQMHISNEEALELWKNDPSKFFNQLIESISKAGNGVEMTQMLSDIGLKSTRDIELVKRLAVNFDLLKETMDNSAEAGSNTGFLEQSMEKLNATMTETIAQTKNALENMMASFGEPFLAPLKLILDGVQALANALSSLGETPVGRVIAAFAGGVTIFIALQTGAKLLQAGVLSVASSMMQVRKNMVEAGLSGQLSWSNIAKAIQQANTALAEQPALYARVKAAQAEVAQQRLTGSTAGTSAMSSGATASEAAAHNAATTAIKAETAAQESLGAARSVATSAASASTAATRTLGAGISAVSGAMAAAGTAVKGFFASLGPAGWASLALSALPAIAEGYNQIANAEEIAAEKAQKAGAEMLSAMGGAAEVQKAVLADTQDIANGSQRSLGDLMISADGAGDAYKSASEKSYYFVNAQGEIVRATREVAQQMGYTTLQIGKNTAELIRNAIAGSEGFKKLTGDQLNGLKELGFDWGEYARKAATEGQGAASAYVQGFIDQLNQKKADLDAAQTQTFKDPNAVTSTKAHTQATDDQTNAINNQINALKGLQDANDGVGAAVSQAMGSQDAQKQILQGLGLSADEANGALQGMGDAADGNASAADKAAEAWDKWKSAVDSAIDRAFGFENAEAAMFDALDKFNQGLQDNGNVINTTTEGGRQNLQNLQTYLKAVAENAMQVAQNLGLTGAEAQKYVQDYVQAAIDQIGQQGIDTSQVQQAMNNVGAMLGQTLPGPQVDNTPTQQGVDQAQQVAQQGVDGVAATTDQTVPGISIDPSATLSSVQEQLGISEQGMSDIYNVFNQTIPGANIDGSTTFSDLQKMLSASDQDMGILWQIISKNINGPGVNYNGLKVDLKNMKVETDSVVGQIIQRLSLAKAMLAGAKTGAAAGKIGGQLTKKGGKGAGNAKAAFQSAMGRYQPTPRKSRGGGGGGGGGGGHTPRSHAPRRSSTPRSHTPRSHTPRSHTPTGGSSKSKQKEKSPAELFKDFLSRLSTAMKESMEKWWKSRSAKDNYHSQLNTMRKKIEDARKTIADAKKSIEDLNTTLSEQQQELRDAKYFNEIAKKYGDKERIQSTQTDIDKANKNINDTRSQIADKEKEIAEAQKGMFALKGYTQAAIENRAALKQLQSTMMEMIEAYAATGASNEQVAAYARQLKEEFINQAVQMGFNRGEVTELAGGFDSLASTIQSVPRSVEESVTDNGTAAATQQAIEDVANGDYGPAEIPTELDEPSAAETGGALDDMAEPREAEYKPDVVRDAKSFVLEELDALANGDKANAEGRPVQYIPEMDETGKARFNAEAKEIAFDMYKRYIPTAANEEFDETKNYLEELAKPENKQYLPEINSEMFGLTQEDLDALAQERTANYNSDVDDETYNTALEQLNAAGADQDVEYKPEVNEGDNQGTKEELDETGEPRDAEYKPDVNEGDKNNTDKELDETAEDRDAEYEPKTNESKKRSVTEALNKAAEDREAYFKAKKDEGSYWGVMNAFTQLATTRTVQFVAQQVGSAWNTVKSWFHNGGQIPAYANGGPIRSRVGIALGAPIAGFAGGGPAGGMIPGNPGGNYHTDNLLAMNPTGSLFAVRSGEYVINRSAVETYGSGMFDAINARRYAPSVSYSGGGIPRGGVDLSSRTIAALARSMSSMITLDGRVISTSVNRYNAVNGQRGSY